MAFRLASVSGSAPGEAVNHVDPDDAGHRAAPQTRNELAQTRTSLAEDRTILANERSLLAWYRTAFGAYALSLGFGAILPSLRKGNPALGRVPWIFAAGSCRSVRCLIC